MPKGKKKEHRNIFKTNNCTNDERKHTTVTDLISQAENI
jgi:hypothetical protein